MHLQKKPNIDGFVKELKRETKKREGGLTRSKEVRETGETGDYVLNPKPIKSNAFTIKPDITEFTRSLNAAEGRKKSGTKRADSVATYSTGGHLYPKPK